jgi:hypothetical protein
MMMSIARWSVLAVLLGACVGCNTSTCDRAEDGLTVTNAEGVQGTNTWFSAPYHDPDAPLQLAPYQYFPPARTITFQHELGSLPESPLIMLTFSDHGSLALAAGNEAIVKCMDEHVIQIKNDTCSDFYIWVTARGSGIAPLSECPIDADAGVAGSPGDTSPAPSDAGAGGAAN